MRLSLLVTTIVFGLTATIAAHSQSVGSIPSNKIGSAGGVAGLDSTSTLTPPRGMSITVNPYLAVCPAANCPTPVNNTGNEVTTSAFLNGATALDANTAEWLGVDSLYVNTGQPNGQKVTRYIGAVQGPLGGTTWALNTDVVRNGIPNGPNGQVGSSSPGVPGALPAADGTVGAELDFTNWDWDAGPGGAFTTDLYIHNQSRFASLAGIYFDAAPQDNYSANTFTAASWASGLLTLTTTTPHGVVAGDYVTLSGFTPSSINGIYLAASGTTASTLVVPVAANPGTVTTFGALAPYSNAAWHDGIFLNGATVARDNAFLDGTSASFGFTAVGGTTTGTGDFYANDGRQYGVISSGSHTHAEFWALGSAPVGIQLDGHHTGGDLIDTGAGGSDGIAVQGTHTNSDLDLESLTPTALIISGTRSIEDINDSGTGPAGLVENGTHTLADIISTTSSPVAISVGGSHSGEDISDTGTGPAGLAVTGTHTLADLYLSSSSNNAIDIYGRHPSQDIQIGSTSPVVLGISGNHSVETYSDTSTTPLAINLTGTYSTAAISARGAVVIPGKSSGGWTTGDIATLSFGNGSSSIVDTYGASPSLNITGVGGITLTGGAAIAGNFSTTGNAAITGSLSVTSGATAATYSSPTVVVSALSGGSTTMTAGQSSIVLDASATLASYTVTLPTGISDGQIETVCSDQTITSLTLGGSIFIVGNEPALNNGSVGPCLSYMYSAATNKYFLTGSIR